MTQLPKKPWFLNLLSWLVLSKAALVLQAEVSADSPGPPNVVLIIIDDQGYGDLSTHGNPWLKTPHLDQLASQSIRLDDFHAAPYCIPSRASLLTGRYADRTGIHNAIEPHWFIRTNEVLLSDVFKAAGYATGMFGKWHLGDNYPYGPEYRNFDEVMKFAGGAVGVLADYWDNCYVNDTYFHNGVATKVSGYCTDVFFDTAIDFIDDSVKQEKPFFVYLPTNTAHGPNIAPPEYRDPFENEETKENAGFYGMIANIDANVGKLRAYLEEKNMDNNTIFIWTTDNGTQPRAAAVYNAGMRGWKMSSYDGGHRVPLFLHWPAGGFGEEKRIETLTSNIDIMPTLLDLCGLEKPPKVQFDGKSLLPLLKNGDSAAWPDRILMTDAQYFGVPKKWVQTTIMSERWRLVEGKELYDIDADPGQTTNVYSKYPEAVRRLRSYYDDLWTVLDSTFDDVAKIPLGHPSAKSVHLNYHDCIGRHMFWYQNGTRNLTATFQGNSISVIDPPESKRPLAFWPINVETDGQYLVELRRWPKEADVAIHSEIPPGEKVYGRPAFRTTPGKGFPAVNANLFIGENHFSKNVEANDAGVTFQIELNKGPQRLSAKFVDAIGRSLDAFFVYVTQLK